MKAQQKPLLFESKLIRAGAGTGKTTCLIQEIYSQFQKQRSSRQAPPRLIVCTFTRKACQELKERLFEKAGEEISKNSSLPSPLFLNYIGSPSLYISTIDGILNLFLKKEAHHLNLPPDFQIDHGPTDEKLFDSFAEEFVFKKNLSLLHKMPYPFLRDLFLIYFKLRLKHGEISLYDESDFKDFEMFWLNKNLIKKEFYGWDLEKDIPKIFKNSGPSFIQMLETLQSLGKLESALKIKEESFKANNFLPIFKPFYPVAEEFFSQFIERKKNLAVLNIEDLLLLSLELLRKKPETAKNFSKEWDGWLIDEYQDTSWAQEQVINHITGFKNVFCVGDPAQSIYFFRGADPYVFKRRELLTSQVKKLNKNYRSIPSLIHFYNDFFEESQSFMKFDPPSVSSVEKDEPCVYFLTYEKYEGYKQTALKALYYYIQKLVDQGASYSDIAILSSKNDDLVEIALSLRRWNVPLTLESSKNFAQNQLILDSLFLLKFLINPFDDNNLKALLRSPYFHLLDQELADASYDHIEFRKSGKISFWTFLKNQFPKKLFVQSLSSYLDMKKSYGLAQSFEKALMTSGITELSYFQDPTGFSESSLCRLISLLHEKKSSALELFYSLTELENEGESGAATPCEGSSAIQIMTIHKSKGLEFKNVIVMDFSLDRSSLKAGYQGRGGLIYDESRKKAVFSVPVGGRDRNKIKSFGHKIALWSEEREKLFERNRLFYVAMTRAKNRLAFFIPNSSPEKNSWLSGVSFFKKFSKEEKPLLEEKRLGQNKKLFSWRLNKGIYKAQNYSFCVQPSKDWAQLSDEMLIKKSKASVLNLKKDELTLKKPRGKKTPTLIKGEKPFNSQTETHFKSSNDFVIYALNSKVLGGKKKEATFSDLKKQEPHLEKTAGSSSPKERAPFSLIKTKNILFKSFIGNHLHSFLQKLSHQGFEKTNSLIDKSFLREGDKKQIKEALFYTFHLKKPLMKEFLKTGFSEWPFKVQKKNVVFQGIIDLWAWDSDEICLFDYKSSATPKAQWQLIFYSWILNELYHPKKIQMFELYPFQKKISSSTYKPSHEELIKSWLNSL